MLKFPWKTTVAGAALLAATVYAFAQVSPGMHGQMMQGQGGTTGSMAQMHQQMMQAKVRKVLVVCTATSGKECMAEWAAMAP
jgi:hypothetical protein